MKENPALEYQSRLTQRQQELACIRRLHQRLWNCFFLFAIATLATAYIGVVKHSTVGLGCLAPAVMAASLVVRSLRKNSDRHGRLQRVADFYESGLVRLKGAWQGHGIGGDEFRPEQHVYAADLDLFGRGSAFEMLCTARSAMGRSTLARWLLNPVSVQEVSARQAAVAELRGRLDLREDCASLSGSLEIVDTSSISDWLCSAGLQAPLFARALAISMPVLSLALVLLSVSGLLAGPQRWFVAVPITLQILVAFWFHRRIKEMMEEVGECSYDLTSLEPLLERFEREQFESPLLQQLQSGIRHSGESSARSVRELKRLLWLQGLRRDEWCALAGSLFLWATNLTILIDRWRSRHGEAFRVWMDSVGQLEALLCLARYAYENPDHVFPVVHSGTRPLFHAEALGHPLLSNEACVRCDLKLGAEGTQFVIVTGSNMAGKSTLLRSVGLNSVLAFAGAPVRAARMEISPYQIACSICVHDSLLEGKSRFRAEVERLKSILDLAQTGPTLFLLDEVLGGTNSKDRLFGTEAVIRQLLDTGAAGLVTSHDLAIAELAASHHGRALNVHFEEHYVDGEMQFDYRMRPGVLTRTNARNIMSALGLLSSTASSGA